MKTSAFVSFLTLSLILAIAACSSAPPPPPAPLAVRPDLGTPPPVKTTPVPIVKARTVAGAGRIDPFVVLFGPPGGGPAPAPKVAVSTFPNIPTLPGFENAPNAGGLWGSVKLTGIFQNNGYTAILEAGGKSYFVRPGDRVDDKFRVISIGPDYITLGTHTEERHFSLGG